MLRGLFQAGAIRGYGIAAGFLVQWLLANVTSKMAFGQVNAFISAVTLLVFLAASGPTRMLVRELGAFGLAERGQFAEAATRNAHLWFTLSSTLAIVSALVGRPHVALILSTIGVTFASSLYSAYFRGIGRYVLGNVEAGVIRLTIFLAILAIAASIGLELTELAAKISYLTAAAIGLLVLLLVKGGWPSMEFSPKSLWPYGSFPLTLTLLAGLEIFFVNFDIIVTTYLYGADVTAEVRVAQQLRSLTMLPLQVYLMFSFDRLSRTLQTGVETTARRHEIALIRALMVVTFLAAIAIAGPFGTLFFDGGTDFLTTLAVLSGVVPMVLFGPKAELVIAAARESNQKSKTTSFLMIYVLITPFLCWGLNLPPWSYFLGQTVIIALFFARLPKTI